MRVLRSLPLLLLAALQLLVTSTGAASATAISGTWIHLSIDPSTAPSAGFCDHWAGAEWPQQRILVVGGDDNVEPDTSPGGLWALDYSGSFEAPLWVNLSINASALPVPYVGGGASGGLRSLPRPAGCAADAGCPSSELLITCGHDVQDPDGFFNATYTALIANSTAADAATWELAGPLSAPSYSSPLPLMAWSAYSWGDDQQTMLYVYGGTYHDAGVDSADLWLYDLSSPSPTWQNVTDQCSGDLPRPLSGGRMSFDSPRGQLVLMGGYSCTTGGVSGLGGGSLCFSNSVWLLNLTTMVWTGFHDPGTADSNFPLARAWHSTVLLDSQLWIFAGQWTDSSLSVYFLNDVQVFDVVLQQWLPTAIKGVVPPVMWSQTSNLVRSPEDGIWHMVTIGGCTSYAWSDVYALKLRTAVTPLNCQAIGAGLVNTTAGTASTFLIQTRQVLNSSNVTGVVEYGAVLTWGVQLSFDVLVIGLFGSVNQKLESQVEELGGGLYEVTYTAYGGATTCGGQVETATVTVSLALDGIDLPGSPFVVPVLPSQLQPNKTTVVQQSDPVQQQTATLTIAPADAYGNPAQGYQDVSRITANIDGTAAPELQVTASTNGGYVLQYLVPAQSDYVLDVLFDGQPISGSPMTVTATNNLNISAGQQLGIQVCAAVVSLFLLLSAAGVVRYHAVPVIKAASPTFTLLILAGCQLAVTSCFMPVVSSTQSDCTAYAWTLSEGCTLLFASLIAKTWRIARIFESRKMRVRVIRNTRLALPVLVAVIGEMVFNAVWVAVDPLRPMPFVSSSDGVSYVACSCSHASVWYAVEFGTKGAMLLWGVSLASQVRKVPAAFNDSQFIGLAAYNVVFCGLAVLSLAFLLSVTPTAIYLMRSLAVLWCVLVTAALMIVPKLLAHVYKGQTAVAPADGSVVANGSMMNGSDTRTSMAVALPWSPRTPGVEVNSLAKVAAAGAAAEKGVISPPATSKRMLHMGSEGSALVMDCSPRHTVTLLGPALPLIADSSRLRTGSGSREDTGER